MPFILHNDTDKILLHKGSKYQLHTSKIMPNQISINRMWVILLLKGGLILSNTECEQHCSLQKQLTVVNRKWVVWTTPLMGKLTTFFWWTASQSPAHFLTAVSPYLSLLPIESKKITHFHEGRSYPNMSFHDQQKVSNTAHFLWRAVSSHLLYDQQLVSEFGHFCEVVAILLWSTESEWLTFHVSVTYIFNTSFI